MRANIVYSRFLFLIAGVLGLLFLTPMYFREERLNADNPPPITHPEFFYGFLRVALACQVLFLVIAIDPVRYRLVIVPAILEKLTYSLAVLILWSQGRVSGPLVFTGFVGLTFGVLFIVSFIALARERWVR